MLHFYNDYVHQFIVALSTKFVRYLDLAGQKGSKLYMFNRIAMFLSWLVLFTLLGNTMFLMRLFCIEFTKCFSNCI